MRTILALTGIASCVLIVANVIRLLQNMHAHKEGDYYEVLVALWTIVFALCMLGVGLLP